MKTVTIWSTVGYVVASDDEGNRVASRPTNCNPAALRQLVETVESAGWVIDWAESDVAQPEPMEVIQAREYVRTHTDDDEHDESALEGVFRALAGRKPDAEDRAQGLWSHCCQLAA